jgi:hexosaminidase
MHNVKRWYLPAIVAMLLFSVSSFSAVNIIPKPKTLTLGTGTFTVPANVTIWGDANSDTAVAWLKELLVQANKPVTVVADKNSAQFTITFGTDTTGFGAEGYSLVVTATGVAISAPTSTGQFYAIQTLRQMFPPEVELKSPSQVPATITLDAVSITDRPRYPWRSVLVDPARTWITLDELRKQADRMSLFKMNVLHMHLTDDEGWRIEIPKYPNLTTVGAASEAGGAKPPAGTHWYYTQAELSAFVQYCALRHITVLPELDMPGHFRAGAAAYPNYCIVAANGAYLKCGSTAIPEVDSLISECFRVCASVFTTSNYIHIGGDEAATPIADYTPFIRLVEKRVRAAGKMAMGWAEIAGTYNNQVIYQDPTTLVEPYLHTRLPGDVVSWEFDLFLDYCNKSGQANCATWNTVNTLQTIYYTPMNLAGATSRGLDGLLWGEFLYINTSLPDQQMWPRLASVAEVGWIPTGSNTAAGWTDLVTRLAPLGSRFDRMGLKWYTTDGLVTWQRSTVSTTRLTVFDNFVPVKNWTSIVFAGRTHAIQHQATGAAGRIFDLRGRYLGTVSAQALARSQAYGKGVILFEDRPGDFVVRGSFKR